MNDDLFLSTNPLRIMIVDDSALVRNMLMRAFETDSEIKILTTAANGKLALESVEQHDVEVIILDIEMPEMDGLTALPQLLKKKPNSRVIIASTLTKENAAVSIKALSLGASDYIEKPSARTDSNTIERFNKELSAKVKSIGNALRSRTLYLRNQAQALQSYPIAGNKSPLSNKITTLRPQNYHSVSTSKPITQCVIGASYSLRPQKAHPIQSIAIACSTGGPQALVQFITQLKGHYQSIPIFITQHMPPTFTTFLAEHLSKTGDRQCIEASDHLAVEGGKIYLAPGDFHMEIIRERGKLEIRTTKKAPENFCRPSADPMLRSLAMTYGHTLLVIILTGMGQDGLNGANLVVQTGGSVIAQDENTSVVWGMPGAVATAGICSAVLPLNQIITYALTHHRSM
jgi:two-component system chemotaxis response regulator CheB